MSVGHSMACSIPFKLGVNFVESSSDDNNRQSASGTNRKRSYVLTAES
jgi:hypothetical protein